MADEKKFFEEKKYAILPNDTIQTFAESSGHSDISEEVASLLAEDVIYRLREATQNSCQFMRHSRRKKLTCEDFNKALKTNDVPPIVGYNSPAPLPFKQTKEGEIFFTDDNEISLTNQALTPLTPCCPGQTSVKAHWLVVEGVQKGSSLSQAIPGGKPVPKPPRTVSDDMMLYYNHIIKAVLGSDEEIMKLALTDLRTNANISPLLPYFISFISTGVKKVSHDVLQLTKLLHTVKALMNNKSLFLEPKPYLDLLVKSILYCIVEPLTASINPRNDHWVLRDYAAKLLGQITIIWSSPVNHLRQQNIQALKDVLCDTAKPFCSHYGAVMGLLSFGSKAVEDVLLPLLSTYMPHLQTVMEDISYANAQVKSDAHKVYGAIVLAAELMIQGRAQRILNPEKYVIENEENDFSDLTNGSVLDAYPNSTQNIGNGLKMPKLEPATSNRENSDIRVEETSNDLIGPVINLPENKPFHKVLAEMYSELYEYLGDSLAIRFPIHHRKDYYISKKKEHFVTLSDEDSRKTGEELLQNFLDVPEVKSENQSHENSMDVEVDEFKSDRTSSRSDRSDENLSFLEDDTDLTVKATVSDPSQGIKLTISKKPKLKSLPPVLQKQEQFWKQAKSESKVNRGRKPSHKYTGKNLSDNMFERVPLAKKTGEVSFVFRYGGTVQISRSTKEDRKRKRSIQSDTAPPLGRSPEMQRQTSLEDFTVGNFSVKTSGKKNEMTKKKKRLSEGSMSSAL